MPVSKIKKKVTKNGVNHLKPVFKTTELYQRVLSELQLSQYNAFNEILEYFTSDNYGSDFILLTGSAGTGKTFLASKVAEYLQSMYFCDVLLTAPTNKAVKVLRKNQEKKSGISFMTIHSALGLEEVIDENGEQKFLNQKQSAIKIHNFDYMGIDESSMVDFVLFNQLLDEVYNKKIKILFIGDKSQIPPVNYPESAVFIKETQEKYKIKEIELTVVIRQHHNNPIISFANKLKDSLDDAKIISKLTSDVEYQNIPQITFLPQTKHEVIATLRRFFLTEEFDIDGDYCKVLAWTNDCVDKFNMLIRKLKFGPTVPQLVIGEKLIFDKPWSPNRTPTYLTNDEVVVRALTNHSIKLFDHEFLCYEALVSVEGENSNMANNVIILKNECYPMYEEVKSYLKSMALSYPKGSMESKGWWVARYSFIKNFALVKYSYAITVHKAQGSTYTHAIVANYDINNNPRLIERNRIKYTAVTRPKETLHIIV